MSPTRIAAAGLAAALLLLTAVPARVEGPDTAPGALTPEAVAALLAQGRDMTWGQTFYLAPAPLALLVAAALAFAVVYAARAARLLGARRSVRGRPLSPGGA
ncbi:hypothetical protein [Nocardiopsis sp. RV163]|uniref:hypothetical protein n=1 Tax=Nocardiopsis sp. RV163 TaxID=1661388 RepID=UPI001F1CCF19|nr:hypothetical protein [Nocardiopsis sp. RV163]